MISDVRSFHSPRHKTLETNRHFIIYLTAAFAIIGWYWFLFFSGFWDIGTLDIKNIKTLDRTEVYAEIQHILQEQPWRPWHQQNMFMLNSDLLASNLRDRLFIEDVRIEKIYPNTLQLDIKEKQRSVIVVSHDQYVNVDVNGIVTGEPDKESLQRAQACIQAHSFMDEVHVPVIVLNMEDPLAPGFQIAKSYQVHRWLDTARRLILGGVKFRFIKLENADASYARFVSEKGYDIYFDLLQPIDPQLYTYLEFMKTKPDQSKITEYLDARVPGKVYVK